MDMFPDIGLLRTEFRGGREWQQESNRRWYLESVAKRQGFDPLKPSIWDSFLRSKTISQSVLKTIKRIFAMYATPTEALRTLFPKKIILKKQSD